MELSRVALALGGNLCDVEEAFNMAAVCLERAGMINIERSSNYQTAPVDCPPDSPSFLNAALTGWWPGTVEELHMVCMELEDLAGRAPGLSRNSPRPLDLDIIFFGDLILDTHDLTIPHRAATSRLFVLIPLAEIAANWPFPGLDKTVKEILAQHKDTGEVVKITPDN